MYSELFLTCIVRAGSIVGAEHLLPPQGFGPEAKTRGGNLALPGCIHTRTKNICRCKSKKCVFSGTRVLDLTKVGAHGGVG